MWTVILIIVIIILVIAVACGANLGEAIGSVFVTLFVIAQWLLPLVIIAWLISLFLK